MITSLQNPLVKQIRKLHRTKGRREQNLSLLEGTHLIETAIEQNCSLVTLCYTDQWQSQYPKLWEKARQQAQRVEWVSSDVLRSLATTVHPDGVIATMSRFLDNTPIIQPIRLGLALERLQDPGNLGTIIRTAAATGVEGIWFSSDTVDLDNPKVLRASTGAWFQVKMRENTALASLIESAKAQGVQVLATLPQGRKIYWEVDFSLPTLIILGNEGAGLSENLTAMADETITIPSSQQVESLNVAIATAVILYEAKRQQFSPNSNKKPSA